MPARSYSFTLILCSLLLTACGGGGGGSDNGNPPATFAPIANDTNHSGDEDSASVTVTLTGSDQNGTIDKFVLKNLPANGQLYIDTQLTAAAAVTTPYTASGNSLSLYFVPAANFNGNTNFKNIAIDNDGLSSNDANATITINPVNDAPVLVKNSLSISEGQTKLISDAELKATDVDNGASELTYTISSDVNGQFERVTTPSTRITSFTQADIAANAIRFVHNGSELAPAYNVAISDGQITTTPIASTVTYTSVNNNPPIITSANSINIAENTNVVMTVTASDADNDAISYSLVSGVGGADNALFNINNSTGLLTFNAAPDYEVPADSNTDNNYQVLVGANDGNTTTALAVTITITNVNDNNPSFTSAAAVSINEGNTVVQTVSATDSDNDTITYSIENGTGGDDNLLFVINASSGILSFKVAPDFESPSDNGANNVYQVLLGASDGTTTSKLAVTVTVNNLNDNGPVFTSASSVNVKQNTTSVQTVTASDADNDTLSYTLQSGSGGEDNLLFALNSSSGILSFKNAPVFATPGDADANNAYQVLLGVSDGNTITTQALTVKVTPIGIPFTEDFSSGSDGWVFFNDYSKTGSWAVTSGKLVQSADFGISIVTKELDETYHKGTYAYLTSGLPLTDYRLSADLTPVKQPGFSIYDDGHDIGLMFRYQDRNNYYRIVLNSEYGYARLDRKVAGVFNTLAVDARGYTAEGVLIHIDVEVLGDLIQVYIDGEARFAVRDNNLSSGSVALYTEDGAKFDNIVITDNSTSPSIVISEPEAYTAVSGSTIAVSAVALNVPTTATVEFDLDGTLCGAVTETSAGFYTASCTAGTASNHTITATLIDGSAIATDSNPMVASSAEIRLVVGDSLSNGVTDTINRDNKSADGKIIGEQGYVAVLHDLLAVSLTTPQMLYNEAVPGDKSTELDQRLPSILARHPEATIAQIMIGTNDAGQSTPIPSGLGCSGAACNGTFKENIQNSIDILLAAGITPIISLIPPAFNEPNPLVSARNNLTQQYNTVLLNDFTTYTTGPDMFGYYLSASENRLSMFADTLHFNGLGYAMMGYLWEHYLNVGTSLPTRSQLPLVYEDICVRLVSTTCQDPLQYRQDLMQTGIPYYVDASHSLLSIPTLLDKGIWLLTANSDNTNTRTDYLSFTIDRNADVYIAYDAAASSLPTWMTGFTDTGQTLTTSNPSASSMKLYHKSYVVGVDTAPDGTIQFGANLATGANGSTANYIVITKAQ